MKLADITAGDLALAAELYLKRSYPGGLPDRAKDRAQFDASKPLRDILSSDAFERVPSGAAFDDVDKFQLRIGNQVYQHMKLGVERCTGGDNFVIIVDTHDRHFTAPDGSSDSLALQDLREHNEALKRDIEVDWTRAGLPTFCSFLKEFTRHQKPKIEQLDKTVLIVDDDTSIICWERELIARAGYHAVAACGGLPALHQVAKRHDIDICLVDLVMPRVDGLHVVKFLREHESLNCPMVFVSSIPPDKAYDRNVSGHVGKPYEPQHLLDTIAELLK